MKNPTLLVDSQKFVHDEMKPSRVIIPVEMPVTLTINGQVWLEFLCTPQYLDSLAIGFLFNEGLIKNLDEIAQVRVCQEDNNVDIWTHATLEKPSNWRRTSGCSGGMSVVEIRAESSDYGSLSIVGDRGINLANVTLRTDQVNDLVDQLHQAQNLHHQSGGVHASGLSDDQKIFITCEDIGRHNTLDKLAGRVLLEQIDKQRLVVLTTGRVSSEMLQKASRLGTPVVISSTSPTSYAVAMAEAWNITLIGYARGALFSIYAHPERIIGCKGDE